jgi:hypothetical protein
MRCTIFADILLAERARTNLVGMEKSISLTSSTHTIALTRTVYAIDIPVFT